MAMLKPHSWSERVRHALIAAALAAVLGAIGATSPLDNSIWAAQALSTPRAASGDVFLLAAQDDLEDPANARARAELASLINRLDDAGAQKIIVNVVFDQPGQQDADDALREAISRSGRAVLVQRFVTTAAGDRVIASIDEIAGSSPQAISKQWVDPFGYSWTSNYSVVVDGQELQSLPAAISGVHGPPNVEFPIDYSVAYASIPKLTIAEAAASLSSQSRDSIFKGRTIVIGNGGDEPKAFTSIPGHLRVPASIVPIMAGETLIAGPPLAIGWLLPLVLATIGLLGVIVSTRRTLHRHFGYAVLFALLPVSFFVLAQLDVFADLSVPAAFLALYGGTRLWKMRGRGAALVDELSGLPSFRKLEHELSERPKGENAAVIVAKVHRFDEVLSSLPAEEHGEYVRLVANRFRVTDDDIVVYSNAGRYLAWIEPVEDPEQLEVHLRGLRAVFAHPLQVGDTEVDVGITFGADATSERNPSRKIAAAASAAERTSEAHAPVLLAQESSQIERQWSVSLQAKIDDALKSGAIFLVYQPQFDLSTGAMIGAEALVRWNDPERGQIPPSYFIEQCEQTGRMEALTRKVFEDAVESIAASPLAGVPFQLSVNVSATLLGDFRVVDMLSEVLASTSLPSSRLTLEITETSRIADYEVASAVMHRLSKLGVRLSIDDFGVGAASLETILRLPFDELKIDRIFVSKICDNPKARAIVESLIALGHDLEIPVIAEGVEDEETLAILRRSGCDTAQGYVLGKPTGLDLLVMRHAQSQPTSTAAG
jgi:EAL domain-containing protein (putative c-di-GMP-specific phosphodiesterase class I)/GGDEF domain-containing protein